jgi:hypothetical protein
VAVAVSPGCDTAVFKTVGAVAAAAIDCAVVTQAACDDVANNNGKKEADSATDSAAIKRSALNQSPVTR